MNKETFSRRVLPALTLIGASGVLLAALDRPSTGIDLSAAPPIGTNAGTSAGVTTTIFDPLTGTPAATTPVVETTVPIAPAACSSTISGPTISTKFGPVQVQASVDGTGLVCASQGIQWPTADQKSVSINNQAIPLLDQWAVHTGNASFNSISGATYTSKAYKQSLQAIIDGVVG
jgi:uncharacterized protein with FMN-binding domain